MKVRSLIGAVLMSAFVLTGCDPSIRKVGNLTGNGGIDILIDRPFDYSLLYIDQKDGTYVKASQEQTFFDTTGNFITDKGQIYVFDGKFYRPAQKKGKVYVFDRAKK
jgi:hypothetical protein